MFGRQRVSGQPQDTRPIEKGNVEEETMIAAAQRLSFHWSQVAQKTREQKKRPARKEWSQLEVLRNEAQAADASDFSQLSYQDGYRSTVVSSGKSSQEDHWAASLGTATRSLSDVRLFRERTSESSPLFPTKNLSLRVATVAAETAGTRLKLGRN